MTPDRIPEEIQPKFKSIYDAWDAFQVAANYNELNPEQEYHPDSLLPKNHRVVRLDSTERGAKWMWDALTPQIASLQKEIDELHKARTYSDKVAFKCSEDNAKLMSELSQARAERDNFIKINTEIANIHADQMTEAINELKSARAELERMRGENDSLNNQLTAARQTGEIQCAHRDDIIAQLQGEKDEYRTCIKNVHDIIRAKEIKDSDKPNLLLCVA